MKQNWKPGTTIYPLPAVLVSCGNTPEEYNLITVSWVGTGPYLMNLFAGPRVSYIFNETSGISTTGGSFRNLIYDESPNSFSFYLIGGLSTTIGHLYIDFRYAYCVGNSKDLSFKVNPDELQTSQVKLSRAVNELSISIGYLW